MGEINSCNYIQKDKKDNEELENGIFPSKYSFNGESKRQSGILQFSGQFKYKNKVYLKQNLTNFINLFQNKLNNNNYMNETYYIEEITQIEFNNALHNNSHAQRIINLLNNYFNNVKYYGDNNIFSIPSIKY